MKLFENLL